MLSQSEIRAAVTNKIVEALKSGAIPFWRRPWTKGPNSGHPTNAISGKPYRGVNWVLLSLSGQSSKWWATYNQWKSLGGQVRKGAKATQIILYKPVTTEKLNDEGEVELNSFPLMKSWSVFHIDQVNGDLAKFRDPPKTETESKFIDYGPAEDVFLATDADVRFGGDRAFYSPSGDYIQMPPKESFERSHEFYGVLAHEAIHWTGHVSRLNRLTKFARFGSEAYALEELVAELGSAYLMSEVGLPQSDDLSNVTAYLDNWLKVLKRDHTAIFSAASAASKAVDHVLEFSRPTVEVESESEELTVA